MNASCGLRDHLTFLLLTFSTSTSKADAIIACKSNDASETLQRPFATALLPSLSKRTKASRFLRQEATLYYRNILRMLLYCIAEKTITVFIHLHLLNFLILLKLYKK